MLDRLRDVLKRPTPQAATVDAKAASLLDDLPDLRASLLSDDLVEAFTAKVTSEKLTGTVEHLSEMAQLPAAVQAYIEARSVQGAVTLCDDGLISGLEWSDIETMSEIGPHAALALGVARLAVAETGSFVMASGHGSPSLHNFLPLHHLVVLPVSRIRPYLEDVWLEIEPRDHRLVSLITGTSGTADIEGRNVRGAHGPRFLHVFLIDTL